MNSNNNNNTQTTEYTEFTCPLCGSHEKPDASCPATCEVTLDAVVINPNGGLVFSQSFDGWNYDNNPPSEYSCADCGKELTEEQVKAGFGVPPESEPETK